jgi:hypothetical protein
MFGVKVENGVMVVTLTDWNDIPRLTEVINETFGGK